MKIKLHSLIRQMTDEFDGVDYLWNAYLKHFYIGCLHQITIERGS